MADDYPGDITTTGRLPIDGTVRGHIDSKTDQDWFHLDLQAGAAYQFTATASDGSEPLIHVYGRTGGVPYVMYTNEHDYVKYNPLTTPYSWVDRDDYYLFVTSDHPVDYTIGVRRVEDDHLNDDFAAIPLTVGSNVGAQIDYRGDEEYFRIAATLGSTYRIRLSADNGVLPSDTMWQMAHRNGWVDFTFAREGDALVATLKADATKDYVIKVNTYSRDPLDAPVKYHVSMTGDVRQLPPDDYNADAPNILISPGASAAARLDYAGDSEAFEIAAVAGTVYTFRLSADTGALPPKVAMWGVTGVVNYEADIRMDGAAQVMTVTAASTGPLVIALKADLDTPLPAPVPYHVSVTASDTAGPRFTGAHGSVDGPLTLSFNEPIRAGTGTIKLVDQQYKVIGTWDMISKAVTIDGSTISIDPGHVLSPAYYSLYIDGAITRDLSGNELSTYNRSAFIDVFSTADGGHVTQPFSGAAGGRGPNDTGVLDGRIADFKITHHDHDTIAEGLGKSYTFTDIERLMFTQSDDVLMLTPTAAASQTWRLYQAVFDRAPDKAGMGFWLHHQDHGMSLRTMAEGFMHSPEFAQRYGANPSDAQFVASLYHNVLHRDGEAAGVAFHIANLEKGMSRADVLTGFSESAENVAATAQLIGDGFVYTPYG